MRKAETLLVFFLLILSPTAISSQETAPDEAPAEKEEVDRRKEILLYGIDSEVLTVLGNLQQEKIGQYNELLTTVIAETRNTSIVQSIYRLWDDTSYKAGLVFAREELVKVTEDEDFDPLAVRSAMAYLANQEDTESLSLFLELTDYRESRIASTAVRSLGKIGQVRDTTELETLLERLKKEDPVAEEDLVAALIVTLGELKYEPAAQELVYIVEDAGASAGHRRLACISVGKIGRSEDFEIIERLYYETDDATLRSYALAGLAEFPDYDTTDILIQALKRDSFWRIRVTAAEKLSGSNSEGVAELLRYKASNDPINHVRIASLKALGTSHDTANADFLLEYFKDKQKATDVRLACLSVLVEQQVSGTNDAVNEVMDDLWEKDEGRFLEFICRDLSRSDWDNLAPIFDRMLDHNSWLLQIYGVRGIRRNSISSLQGKVNALDKEGIDERVRREVTTGI